ncbi:MAG: transglycosylase SLT domain-containing protein [Moorella sp. (in: firmicutes)]
MLTIYLGRKPKPIDVIEHSTQLMRGELPMAGPETRTLQKILQQLQTMRRAEQSGGTAQSGATYRPPAGKLTDSDLVNLVNEAVRITGVPSNWTPYLLWLAKAENASLDPTAVNPVPVNGEHATGLMQTLPSTFRAYAVSGMTDIYNPLHNMVAAIRYIKSRYGHPSRIPGIGRKPWRGY